MIKMTNSFNYLRKVFLILMSLLAISPALIAQQGISGTITDATDGTPLIGATVLIKGTTNGTVTDVSGNFLLENLEVGNIIEVSFLGYISQDVVYDGTIIRVSLKQGSENLNEVVITALGIERATKALGYSVQEVNGGDLIQVKDPNLLNNLTGRVAGVQIVQGNSGVGSSSKMVIRGESSLSGDNQPLFIVDGVPVNNYTNSSITDSDDSGAQEVDYGNGAGDINPDDIESISILKGASAAALYGSRAANGVVLITTKSGKGTTGIGVSFNHTTTFERFLVLPKWQDSFGEGSVGEWMYEDGRGGGINDSEDLSWGPALDNGTSLTQFDGPSMGIVNGEYVPVRGGDVMARRAAEAAGLNADITATPWTSDPGNVNDFFETGVNMSNSLALTGANNQGNFRLSFTNLNSDGIIPNNDLDRNTVSLNAGYNLSKRLKVNTSATYLSTHNNHRPGMGYGSENPMYVFAWYGRQVNTQALKDYWQAGQENIQQFNYNYAWHDNPYINSFENTNAYDKNRLLGNISATYSITNALSLMVRSGLDFFRDSRVSKRVFSTQRFPRGMYREDDIFWIEHNTDFLFTYNKLLNTDWGINVSLGGNRMSQSNNFTSSIANELSVPGIFSLNNSAIPVEITQYDTEKRINSLYGLGQIDYKEMLYLEFTGRNDWSSTLPAENNSYFYPSVSLSAVISEIFDLPNSFSFTKIRAGYAEVGNDTDPYRLRSVYLSGTPYNSIPAVTEEGVLLNADLEPERQKSFELGADVRFVDNRIGLDLTYYNTLSNKQIIQLPQSVSSGYSNRFINAGEVRNYGIEATLYIQPLRMVNGFTWDVFINYAANRSKVISISEGLDEYIYASTTVYSNQSAQVFAIARVGDPLGNIYGTGFEKVNGQVVFENGLPVPDNELRLLGNYNPDYIAGIGNTFSYKNMNLSFLFEYRKGGVVVSRMFSIATTGGNLDHTVEGRNATDPVGEIVGEGVMFDAETNSYVPNTVAIAPQDYFVNFYKREHEESSTFDATFLKLREVKLGYVVPESFFRDSFIQGVSIAIVGRNLALLTDQHHFDPETLTYEGEQSVTGVEEMSYPSTRSFGFNININF